MKFLFYFQNPDEKGELDIQPSAIITKLDSWLDSFVKLLPNIGIAILLIIIGFYIAKFASRFIVNRAKKKERINLGEMIGALAKWIILLLITMLAITIVFPSVKPVDLIAGLGVSSVAIGFAFQDILQNWLAGLLLLIRQPFEINDQIKVNGYEGTVKKIETRSTIIQTYAGERIVIPNNEIYTSSVKVNTAHEAIRSQYDVGIGYADDMDNAIQVLKSAVEKVDGLSSEREVEVLPWGLDASWVTLRIRWWTDSQRSSVVQTMVKVIAAIKKACDDAGIDMPYDTYVQLIHDQTEARDGIRGKQREGWPADKDNPTQPKWKAKAKNQSKDSDS